MRTLRSSTALVAPRYAPARRITRALGAHDHIDVESFMHVSIAKHARPTPQRHVARVSH